MTQGQGIFVNSKRLHYCYSDMSSNSKYICLVFNPFILCKKLGGVEAYLEKKFSSSNDDAILFTSQDDLYKILYNEVNNINHEMNKDRCNPLCVLSHIFHISDTLWHHVKPVVKDKPDGEHWLIMWKMTGYIHKNYDSKISLDDIATAGSVCRTRCFELFNKYLLKSPGTYLNEYRIQKSYEMLNATTCSIAEVALSCGFQSPSYFTYVFRKTTGLTPKEYRSFVL